MSAIEEVQAHARDRVDQGLRAAIDLLGHVAQDETATELAREVLLAIRGLELDLEEMSAELARGAVTP